MIFYITKQKISVEDFTATRFANNVFLFLCVKKAEILQNFRRVIEVFHQTYRHLVYQRRAFYASISVV